MADVQSEVSDPFAELTASLNKSREIAAQVLHCGRAQEEHERRLSKEIKAHLQTKEKYKAMKIDHKQLREKFASVTKEHKTTKSVLASKERFNAKVRESLKTLADDLVCVRLQNESLKAEMELQRKAFAVNVNWAARYAELKTKVDEYEQEYRKLHAIQLQTKKQLNAVLGAQEEYMASHCEHVEELERVRGQLAEQQKQLGIDCEMSEHIAEQLSELETLKRQIEIDAVRKIKNKDNAKKLLEKSLFAGDQGILRTVFGAWAMAAKSLKIQKQKKEQNTSVAIRVIANSSTAVMDFCITAWFKILGEKRLHAIEAVGRELVTNGDAGSASKRSRQKALAQLEKQFGKKDKGLLREVIASWTHVKIERRRKEKTKAMAYRTVAGNSQALLAQLYRAWFIVLEDVKKRREKKASRNARAVRMIANSSNATMEFCLTQWAQVSKKASASKHSKDDGHMRALKMIAGMQATSQTMVIQMWDEYIKKDKSKRKKLRAVERNLISGDHQLLHMTFCVWKVWQEAERKKMKSKIGRMRVAQKRISGQNGDLMLQVFRAWDRFHDDVIFQRRQQELEDTTNCYDTVGLDMSAKEVESIRKELETWKTKRKETLKKIDTAEDKLAEKIQALQLREMDLSKLKKELDESRKKARDIHEELTKVGQFLAHTPHS